MAQVQELKVEARERNRQGPGLSRRAEGPDPRHRLWRQRTQPETVAVDRRTLERHVETGTSSPPCSCWTSPARRPASFPRQVQLDPVSDRPVHVDFMRLAEGASVRLAIPVHFKGQGEFARPEEGRRAQHRAPRNRAALPGRQHSRISSRSISPAWTSTTPSTSRRSSCRKASSRSIRGRDFTVCLHRGARPASSKSRRRCCRRRCRRCRAGRRSRAAEGAAGRRRRACRRCRACRRRRRACRRRQAAAAPAKK